MGEHLLDYLLLDNKPSIWEYLLPPFCRLFCLRSVFGIDQHLKSLNTIINPAGTFFVDTHGIVFGRPPAPREKCYVFHLSKINTLGGRERGRVEVRNVGANGNERNIY